MRWFFYGILIICFSWNVEAKEPKARELIIYSLINEPIDVVIPCTKKDVPLLELCIQGIRDQCSQIRRVIVLSPERYTDQAEWYDERDFPFSKQDVAFYLCGEDQEKANDYLQVKDSRIGWYFQQLLKMYVPFVIPGISSNVLMLDADTIFLNPVTFMNESGEGFYNPGTEYNYHYFNHINLLTGNQLKKIFPFYSGISHHMLFQKAFLEDLFYRVETLHQRPFWQVFSLCVQAETLYTSGASEYELYFNFIFSNSRQPKIRLLRWQNIHNLQHLASFRYHGYHYVSCHQRNE